MDSKHIFLDIDGTIFDHSIGIPESTKKAISMARKKGNKVYICTGRPNVQVWDGIREIGFDGYIYASGAEIEVDGKRLHWEHFSEEEVNTIREDAAAKGMGCTLQGSRACYEDEVAKELLKKEMGSKGLNSEMEQVFLSQFQTIEDWEKSREEICKIILFSSNYNDLLEYKKERSDRFNIVIHSNKGNDFANGEASPLNLTKASGIEMILQHTQGTRANTYAYGDSMNDIEMIQYCAVGICMENGVEKLKAEADEVCGSIWEDGIYNSFKKHGLI